MVTVLTISLSFVALVSKITGSIFLILLAIGLTWGSLVSWNDPKVSGHGWINFILSTLVTAMVILIIVNLVWEIQLPQLIEVVP